MGQRSLVSKNVSATVALTGLVLSLAGFAPHASHAADTFGWGGECREQPLKQCILSQEMRANNGVWLAAVRIAPNGTGPEHGARFQLVLPAGVHLGSGAFYRVDRASEVALDYIRCTDAVCFAERELSPAEWSGLRKGGSLYILFRPAAGAAPAELSVSLTGITAAFKALAL